MRGFQSKSISCRCGQFYSNTNSLIIIQFWIFIWIQVIQFHGIFQPWHCHLMPLQYSHTTIPRSVDEDMQACINLHKPCFERPELAFQQRGNQRDAACVSFRYWGFDSMFFSALRSDFNMKYRLWHDKSERSLDIGHSHCYNPQSVLSSQPMHNGLYVFHILYAHRY